VLSKLRRVLRKQRIGDILAGLLLAKGLLSFVHFPGRIIDLLTAYLYNRHIHGGLVARPPESGFGLIEVNRLIVGFLLIWSAALVYSWLHDKPQRRQQLEGR